MRLTVANCTKLSLPFVAAMMVGVGNMAQPVLASTGEAMKLVDKPFEECLIKHFQVRFFNRIDADVAQREKLSGIFVKRAEETRPLREQLRQGLLELNELMAQEGATDEQIIEKAHQVRDIRNKVMDERLKSALQVRAVLSQAQRQFISDKISGLITGQWKSRLIGAR